MRQITVKRAVEAWYWIHNNDHQEVGTEYHHTRRDKDGLPERTHIYFKNYFEKMRVPEVLLTEVMAGIKANKRKFDTRMFALKPHAKEKVIA